MRRAIVGLGAAALLAACSDDECAGSCSDGFFLSLAGVEVEGGTWVVRAVVDGATILCEVELPLRERSDPIACTDPAVALTPGPAQRLGQLAIAGTPERVEVTVTVDGAEVASGEFEPRYEEVRLGPGCPVACRQASGALSTPSVD